MSLSELLEAAGAVRVLGGPVPPERLGIAWVGGDSRTSEPGELFISRAPDVDAAVAHAIDAAARGAAAVLVPPLPPELAARLAAEATSAVRLEADVPTEAGARLVERFAGDPSRRLELLAVTGTNGKTTTSWLARQLLAPGRPGQGPVPVGLIGTVSVHDGRAMHDARLTTPDPFELSPLLARMVDHGCPFAVMEASSHGLDQGRLAGVRLMTAIFTNLSGDHLDYHGTMDAYAAAKRRLFELLDPAGTAIVNVDDERGESMAAAARGRTIRVSAANPSADLLVRELDRTIDGTRLHLAGPWGSGEVMVPLTGAYNAMNAAQAAAAAAVAGIAWETILGSMGSLTAPPGRLEPVPGGESGAGPRVFVDYAHTDDALDRMLAAVAPRVPSGGRLVAVFGCGGDRDRTKRPRMAAAAARHADLVILTSDNPRTEDPERILDDIAAGVPSAGGPEVRREVDRGRAIRLAVELAGPADVVVIAGKGHERDQIVGTQRRPFHDVEVARAALAEVAGPREAAP
ncbi:MAG: UDP-N-acetylmuramoyl-L-alanyl-D-glutamate--2,6-diaminopimelate ligase [Planctomycetota bacterium]|jgi:UDP-N-acetylmuramoyl-L-alanyl-D-glutamate--2,6-diaminopimelate ligase